MNVEVGCGPPLYLYLLCKVYMVGICHGWDPHFYNPLSFSWHTFFSMAVCQRKLIRVMDTIITLCSMEYHFGGILRRGQREAYSLSTDCEVAA